MLTSALDAGELASFAYQTSGRKPCYSLNNRLDEPQGQCEHCEQEKILLPNARNQHNPLDIQPITWSLLAATPVVFDDCMVA